MDRVRPRNLMARIPLTKARNKRSCCSVSHTLENKMSRSGYSDDCEQWSLIRWRGAVASAIRGRRGQAFLKEMLAALDALPQKRLVQNELEECGEVCALGAVGKSRGLDMSKMDPENHEGVAAYFGVAHALACEVMFENDEGGGYWNHETPEKRFDRMRAWIVGHLRETA
jgi:hypothetical protein